MADDLTHAQAMALWMSSFFDELVRCGVREVVVSPGSRSTPLAMAAFELSCRRPEDLRVFVDVDERGAAFLGLGLAKAAGRPVALVCTSGTATANYYPAVIEAETSRVPLVVLTGDRPPRLQGLGAPQTTDQLKLYGDHVRAFRAMPLPAADAHGLAFVRQAAREAVLAAMGGVGAPDACGDGAAAASPQVASRACERFAGPVHLNFPFDEPLKPDFPAADAAVRDVHGTDAFSFGRPKEEPKFFAVRRGLAPEDVRRIASSLACRRTLVLAGEGTCSSLDEAQEVADWARRLGLPVLADPLSGLRMVDESHIIDAYDAVFGRDDCPLPDAVIRFGRWPVSKRATAALAAARPFGIVVDEGETRDYNASTDWFVAASPLDFVRSCSSRAAEGGSAPSASAEQQLFLEEWIACNDVARCRIDGMVLDARKAGEGVLHEGAVISALLREAPAGSCLFAANSMTVRNVDTFLRRRAESLCVMANRGQNGIDGTLSTAIGAAQRFRQTTFVTGDLTLQHDINALALQHELLENQSDASPALVVVLMNNDGGAIFDMLPQASDDPYFRRLFLTPQRIEFSHAARAFRVPYRLARSEGELVETYRTFLRTPGISLIEVRVSLRGLKERLGGFWR